jgi:hypothetical protein
VKSRALLAGVCLLIGAGAGLAAGLVLRSGGGAPPAERDFPELPVTFTRGRPVLEDIRGEHFRAAVVADGGPVRLLKRHCFQGHLELGVFDRAGRPVHIAGKGEAYEDLRADCSQFVEKGLLRLAFYTWDARDAAPAPWRVEAVIFAPGRPAQSSSRIALPLEPADSARVAELLQQAAKGWELYRASPVDSPDSRKGLAVCETSLNHLRNVGVGRPGEIAGLLRDLKWPDGHAAKLVERYLGQLEEVERLGVGPVPRR